MDSAYLFHGLLRAKILWAHKKENAVHKLEGVPQHELFHFPIVDAAPVGSGQKRPADFNLAIFLVISVESGRPNDPAILSIDGDQCSSRFQGFAEKPLENIFLVTVIGRMLFPNEGI